MLGDLNAYREEDPIDALRAGGLVDLLAQHVPEGPRYSYVHDAQAGYLDHALATPALADKVTGATDGTSMRMRLRRSTIGTTTSPGYSGLTPTDLPTTTRW